MGACCNSSSNKKLNKITVDNHATLEFQPEIKELLPNPSHARDQTISIDSKNKDALSAPHYVDQESHDSEIKKLAEYMNKPMLLPKKMFIFEESNKNRSSQSKLQINIQSARISATHSCVNLKPSSSYPYINYVTTDHPANGTRFLKIQNEFFQNASNFVFNADNDNELLKNSYLNESTDGGFEKECLKIKSIVNGTKYEIYDMHLHADQKFYLDIHNQDDFTKLVNERNKIVAMCAPHPSQIFSSGKIIATNIIQGKGNTCSVTAALISLARFDSMFNTKFIKDLFVPKFSHEILRYPKFGIRAFFNGTKRVILIDNSLPIEKTTSECYLATTTLNETWPAYVEKAISKLYDSTEFKIDSTFSYELYHLCGWVPEILELTEFEDKNLLWTKLMKSFKEGHILVALSYINETNDKCKTTKNTNIIENHVYVVLNLEKVGQNKIATIMDPWNNNSKLSVNVSKAQNQSASSFKDKKTAPLDASEVNGSLELDWITLCNTFNTIYLSWNPSIYNYRKTLHCKWHKGNLKEKVWNEDYCLINNPQFLIKINPHEDDLEIRVFVDRHVNKMFNYDLLKEQSIKKETIAMKMYMFSGNRVVYPHESIKKTRYSNRELYSDVFIFEPSTQPEYFTLVLLRGISSIEEESTFSIYFLSFGLQEIFEIPFKSINQQMMFNHKIIEKSLGVTFFHPNFIYLPGYTLELKKETEIEISSQCNDNICLSLLLIRNEFYDLSMDIPYIKFERSLSKNIYYQEFAYFFGKLQAGKYVFFICAQGNKEVDVNIKITAFSSNYTNKPNQLFTNQTEIFNISFFNELKSYFQQHIKVEMTKRKLFKSINFHKLLTSQVPCFKIAPQHPCKLKLILKSIDYEQKINESPTHVELDKISLIIYQIDSINNIPMKIMSSEKNQESPWGYVSPFIQLNPTDNLLVFCLSENSTLNLCQLSVLSTSDDVKVTRYDYQNTNIYDQKSSFSDIIDSFYDNIQDTINILPLNSYFTLAGSSRDQLISVEFSMNHSNCDIYLVKNNGESLAETNPELLIDIIKITKQLDSIIFTIVSEELVNYSLFMFCRYSSSVEKCMIDVYSSNPTTLNFIKDLPYKLAFTKEFKTVPKNKKLNFKISGDDKLIFHLCEHKNPNSLKFKMSIHEKDIKKSNGSNGTVVEMMDFECTELGVFFNALLKKIIASYLLTIEVIGEPTSMFQLNIYSYKCQFTPLEEL